MSYLEMANGIENMSSGIISVWFRDATKGNAPEPTPWPTDMVPPDVVEMVKQDPKSVYWWNSYGMPISQFQGGILNAASVMMPLPPPFPIDKIHMLLAFGKPDQNYMYGVWESDDPSVIDSVYYTGAPVPGIGFEPSVYPPPYAPYFTKLGKFKVKNIKLSSSRSRSDVSVSQSFIGVDSDGYIIICLQTDTKAKYKGYAFMLDKITEMWAQATWLKILGPPYSYTQLGFPYPDGEFQVTDGYWNGYQFEYKDISDDIMGVQAETFVIGGPGAGLEFIPGPRVSGNTWHHLLFSFDIGGTVHLEQPDPVPAPPGSPPGTAPTQLPPVVNTACKAWLALDDKNYTDMALQHRRMVPDGFTMPILPGVGTDITGFGPVTSYPRSSLSLGPNDILPQNAWIRGIKGNPKSGLQGYASNAPVWTQPGSAYVAVGDFNALAWAASLWPLYHDKAPGQWLPKLDPPRPTTPDPKTLDVPTYEGGPFNIPAKGYPIGIPASTHHLDHNTGIEMGEMQIWANQTLNTGDVNMRRLFIDDKGKPVSPSKAAKVLGKPDVLLHGSNNWKRGKNTGLGDDFKPTAKILAFVPNPQLGK